ncbi:unnamed protein product, partial [Musa textilis]
PAGVDPCHKLCKIMLSCPNAGLEQALDASGVRAFPDVAEQVLLRFENAGMLAYRFFDWARRQQRGYVHTVRAYHTMIAALAKIRQYKLMWELVAAMRAQGALNVETFCVIMRKYARAHRVEEALYTFDVMEKYGVAPNLAAFGGLLGALCKSKNVRKAQEVFDKMRDRFEPDAKTYSILLEGWGRAPNLPKMREVYQEMLDRGCEPDIVTYGIIVDALCKAGRMEEAVDVVRDMSHRGCLPTPFIYSVLVHTYGVEKRIEDAVDTFLEMERNGVKPDVVVYNALVGAFCKANKFENAFSVVGDMEDKGITPVARTFTIVLNSLITAQRYEEAYRVFRRMIKCCEPDSDTYTVMIKMFCETNRLEMALKVWKYMGKKQFLPSMHTFSVLINGLCRKGELDRACVMLEDMIEKGIRPPGTTFGKLRQLLLKEGREDVLKFLVDKMNVLIQEPLLSFYTNQSPKTPLKESQPVGPALPSPLLTELTAKASISTSFPSLYIPIILFLFFILHLIPSTSIPPFPIPSWHDNSSSSLSFSLSSLSQCSSLLMAQHFLPLRHPQVSISVPSVLTPIATSPLPESAEAPSDDHDIEDSDAGGVGAPLGTHPTEPESESTAKSGASLDGITSTTVITFISVVGYFMF